MSRSRLGFALLVLAAGCSTPTAEQGDAGLTRDTGTSRDTWIDVYDDAYAPAVDTGTPRDTWIDVYDDVYLPLVDSGTTPDDAFVGTDAAVVTTGCELTTYPALDADELRASGDLVTALQIAPGRDDIFVVERNGRILIMDTVTGAVGATPFLNVNSIVGNATSGGDERGLLGLAFDPDYATNGLFYVDYSPHGATAENRVAVGHVSAGTPDVADATITTILAVPDFAPNHNGGQLAFGPDGLLYVGIGDGGGAGDPMLNGQDTTELLGKILRLDVNATGYTIPATNPFAASAGDDEIWAYGLRNPWRFSFDRLTGDLFIADVGQDLWEEIDFVPAGTGAGDNFGWSICEGTHDFNGTCSSLLSHHAPIYEYAHGGGRLQGFSITGGYVYRGAAMPGLNGTYLFGDAATDFVGALRYCDGAARDVTQIDSISGLCSGISTFGEDANGEILMGCRSGAVLRIIPG